jgi:uncharacterized protein (DUF2062 family)/2-polyprenyl-3-methyl-5-hydroxy-6-metoxy-1,4-benzoquinol methylase
MKSNRALRELLYRLRTEGDTPGRLAAAVGVGVYIGCSPFYGFHLLLCLVAARVFRLNRMLTYLASHISLPGVWPLLAIGQIQLARRLRGEPFLAISPNELHEMGWREMIHLFDWQQLGGDLLVGSVITGILLGIAFAVPTYRIAVRRAREPEVSALVESAAYRYLGTGMFHWEFVRGKLRHDPVYFHLLREGVLPDAGRLLDLGCGRGILFSLIVTTRAQTDPGEDGLAYPPGWAPPPRNLKLSGIEGSAKIADVAREALGAEAHIEHGDLATAPLPPADAVLLLDVLHYLPAAAQEDLLARVAAALSPGGLLLIRDADAAGGGRFLATRLQERLCALARRHWRQRFHYRTRAEWSRLLRELGFAVEDRPMAEGTPYANVLIVGRRCPPTLPTDTD